MKPSKAALAILTLTATLNAGTIGIGFGPNGSFGGYSVTSPDQWAQQIAQNYAPSAQFGGGFLSFCLEKNELFYPGVDYQYSISDAAVRGGTSSLDPISVGTGYLYSLFATGQISGNTVELQNAIWYLEGEAPRKLNLFDAFLVTRFGSIGNADDTTYNGESAASFGVWAINVGTPPRYAGQDQLVYIPAVPEAGRLASVAAIALAALVAIKRKVSR